MFTVKFTINIDIFNGFSKYNTKESCVSLGKSFYNKIGSYIGPRLFGYMMEKQVKLSIS